MCPKEIVESFSSYCHNNNRDDGILTQKLIFRETHKDSPDRIFKHGTYGLESGITIQKDLTIGLIVNI